ncbi:uroporphyrinogen decarboxylase family protein [Paenibacillus hamazuiensis]|uniref:uroporphyrinogen decarboxylase family protein n=1 Tax=Paenibacillus hamazuiensis TaxID=2936508 RepID=UPI00200D432C|nr:uroporphyrinogen decarboxylase family protein [Paenibacillus hamazuiensis]
MKITGTMRIKAALRGEKLDRVPYSFWTHLPLIDLDPVRLAEETYRFYKTYDLDFIKNMPNGMFSIEDFGCVSDYAKVPHGGVAEIVKYGIESPDDWTRLVEPDVTDGALGRELDSLELLLDKVKGEAPVVVTIFTPLTTASKLCGPLMLKHIKQYPEQVKAGLELITRVTVNFAKEALRRGCAGVFCANQMATYSQLTEEEYIQFGVPYDKQVLNSISNDSWFNILHIHGTDIMHKLLIDYPVHAFNWHIWETAPSVSEFIKLVPDKTIVGGLQRFHITNGRMEDLRHEIKEVSGLVNNNKLILAPGCVIRYPVRQAVLEELTGEIIRSTGTVAEK